jgi:hypothetical protein
MTTPELWLAQFLHQRGLQQPNGKMLYAYRLEEVEYVSLRDLVGTWLSDKVMCTSGHIAPGVAQLFVLYGAAWWQRQYAGGPWRWEDVISSFGGDPEWWPTQFRTQCVQVGLQYWKQQLPVSGKRYFGVLVEQGGLPRMLLANSKGNIYTLIRSVLRRAARLGAEVDEIAMMVVDYEDKLPRSLKNETVHRLIAQVVGAVLDLKREFKLKKGDDAVAKLTQLAPRWRERFPVALDDQAAVALLGDLVGEAAAIEAETRVAPVVAERLLVEEEGVYALVSRVDFPKFLPAEVLASMLKVDPSSLPFRLTVDLQLNKPYHAADVRKALGAGNARYQFAVLRSQWRGDAALHEHLLSVPGQGLEPVTIPVPGGVELNPGSPWVFVANDEECRLVAQGSVNIRQEHAFVVVDDTSTVVADGAASHAEHVGRFASDSLSRSVFKVGGVVIVSDNGQMYQIRTRHAGAEFERLVWEGRRLPFASTPSLAFYGVPKLSRYTADGGCTVVPSHELEWRVAGTTRVVDPAAARGTVDVMWRADGAIRLRSRMVLFDREPLRFQSDASVSQGKIHIPAGWAVQAVTIDDPALRMRHSHQGNRLTVDLEAVGQPPELVRLLLDWKAAPMPCQLRVPFPASGGHFVDANETRLDGTAAITRDGLLGIRLRIFDFNPDHPLQHKIAFSLRNSGTERQTAAVAEIEHIVALQNNRAEVRLIDYQHDINSLLSLTDALDAVVTVSLWAGRRQAATLPVKRYEFALIPDGTGVAVSPADLGRLTPAALSGIELFAVPVEAMHGDNAAPLTQQISEGVPAGHWHLPANALDHQWLVYPARASRHNFRAVMLDPGYVRAPVPVSYVPPPESMEAILQVSEPVQRRAMLTRRLDLLAEDYTHPEWQIVEGIWCNLGHLTLPTLDLWRAFAINPAALAAFACRTWDRVSPDEVLALCGRFQGELGVMWETIALHIWSSACVKLGTQYTHLLPGIEPAQLMPLVADRIGTTLRAIRQQIPALDNLLAFVAFQHTGQEAEKVALLRPSRLPWLKSQLWDKEDAPLQAMLRNVGDRKLPPPSLYHELAGLQTSPATEKTVLSVLWDPRHPTAGVANVPILLALCICNGLLPGWWQDPRRLIQVREYRDFDRDWFCHAIDQGVAMFIAANAMSIHNNQ